MISVVITVFNKEKYLKKCFDCLMKQTYQSYELIIIDDGSTDGSGELCREAASNDKRVKYYYQDNQGLIAARKTGLKNAKYSYVAFIDADDYIDKDYLQTLISFNNDIENEYDLVCTNLLCESEMNNYVWKSGIADGIYHVNDIINRIIYDDRSQMQGIVHSLCGKILKRDILIKAIEDIDTRITLGEDGLIIFSYLQHAKCVNVQSYSGYHYVLYEQSMVRDFSDKDYWRLNLLKEQYIKIAKANNLYDELCGAILSHIGNFYMEYTARERNRCYTSTFRIPPFLYEKSASIVVYGAGKKGQCFREDIKEISNINCVAWVDRKYSSFAKEMNVLPIDILKNIEFDYILIAIEDRCVVHDVVSDLLSIGINFEKIWPLEKIFSFV